MKILAAVILAVALSTTLAAQQRLSVVWVLGATGQSSAKQANAHLHTIQAEPSGSPTGCTVKLEGSLDGVSWFDLSGDLTCTSAVMLHITDKPVMFVRVNLTALSGGTSPSVVVRYLGVQ